MATFLLAGMWTLVMIMVVVRVDLIKMHNDSNNVCLTNRYNVLDVSDENVHVHNTNDFYDIDDLNVLYENLHVHTTDDIDNLNVQNENLHVHSINNIDNLNVHNHCLHVHDEECHYNFTCSEYKVR